MERLGLTWPLMEAYGLTTLPRAKVLAPETADVPAITRFHAREYVDILRAVSAGDWVPHAARYGLGPGDNPIFPGLWEAAQFVAGGSLLAARLVADGEVDRAFHFAGGLHHAMPDRASGFCYVNDAVLAILALRQRGLEVRLRGHRCAPRRRRAVPRSTATPMCSPSPPTSVATGSFPAPDSWTSGGRAPGWATR